MTDHLIEPPLVVASWYLGVGFTSRASGEASYPTAVRAGLVCTMMIVFEYRVGPAPMLLYFKQTGPYLTANSNSVGRYYHASSAALLYSGAHPVCAVIRRPHCLRRFAQIGNP